LAEALALEGGALLEEGKNKEAEAILLESLAVGRSENPNGVWQFTALFRLEVLHERRGDWAGAKDLARQMVDIYSRNFGPDDSRTATVKLLWAGDASVTGEMDAAVATVREAMPLIQKTHTGCSADRWRSASSASRIMLRGGYLPEAERYARDSLAATCGWDEKKEPRVGEAWEFLGDALKAEGKSAESVKAFEHADAIYQSAAIGAYREIGHKRLTSKIAAARSGH